MENTSIALNLTNITVLRKQRLISVVKGFGDWMNAKKRLTCLDKDACKNCSTFLCPDNENPLATKEMVK